jgi:pyruvate dehydrogenase E1 component alpha subunit
VEAEASDYAADLRARCLALPDPQILDCFDYVYAEQTPYLVEQKANFAEYLATFEGADSSDELRQPEPAYGGGV